MTLCPLLRRIADLLLIRLLSDFDHYFFEFLIIRYWLKTVSLYSVSTWASGAGFCRPGCEESERLRGRRLSWNLWLRLDEFLIWVRLLARVGTKFRHRQVQSWGLPWGRREPALIDPFACSSSHSTSNIPWQWHILAVGSSSDSAKEAPSYRSSPRPLKAARCNRSIATVCRVLAPSVRILESCLLREDDGPRQADLCNDEPGHVGSVLSGRCWRSYALRLLPHQEIAYWGLLIALYCFLQLASKATGIRMTLVSLRWNPAWSSCESW